MHIQVEQKKSHLEVGGETVVNNNMIEAVMEREVSSVSAGSE